MLQGLAEAEGVTSVHAAYAEAVAEKYLVDFMRTRQVFRRPGTHVCLYRLLGKRCPRYSCPSPSMIPGADHMSEWLQGGKTVCLISQPYGLSYDAMRDTVTFCERYGLEADIHTWPSWHCPGAVLTLFYTVKGQPLRAVPRQP
jgi:hypothetical protein